jgi:hypothetical protein
MSLEYFPYSTIIIIEQEEAPTQKNSVSSPSYHFGYAGNNSEMYSMRYSEIIAFVEKELCKSWMQLTEVHFRDIVDEGSRRQKPSLSDMFFKCFSLLWSRDIDTNATGIQEYISFGVEEEWLIPRKVQA